MSKESAHARWLEGVPDDKKHNLIRPGVFESWAEATWATDPEANRDDRGMLRASNGVIADGLSTWMAGKAPNDAGKICVPTFVIHAEWDADLPSYQAHEYFAALRNTPYKRLVELGESTHTVMLERNRMQFFREIAEFLDESDPLPLV